MKKLMVEFIKLQYRNKFDLQLIFSAVLQIPWNPMGWDGTDQVVPWYDFVVPSHAIRSPGTPNKTTLVVTRTCKKHYNHLITYM